MSRPRTTVIPEVDDERTLIEPRFAPCEPSSNATTLFVRHFRCFEANPLFDGPWPGGSSKEETVRVDGPTEGAFARWGSAWMRRSGRMRIIIIASATIALVLGFGALAYQQWRVASALRQTIDRMKVENESTIAGHPGETEARRLTPVDLETTPNASSRRVEPNEREALEHRGASLLVSNDFPNAFAHYRMLTGLFPDEAVFRDVVTVLRSKLRCSPPGEPANSACP